MRRTQFFAAEPMSAGGPASARAGAVADNLAYEAIVELAELSESYSKSAGGAAWRGDRATLRMHVTQLRATVRAIIQTFNDLSKDPSKVEPAPSFDVADSAAYAMLSPAAKRMLELVRAASANGAKSVQIEVESGRLVNVKLTNKWLRFGDATPENTTRARSIVDHAEAVFEAERATKQ